MIIITKKGKMYKWNHKRLLKNLYHVLVLIFFIVTYLYVSNMNYLTLKGL